MMSEMYGMFTGVPDYLWWCLAAFLVWFLLVFTGLDDLIPDIPFVPLRGILLAAGIFGGVGILLYSHIGVVALYVAAAIGLIISVPITLMFAKVKADSKDIKPNSISGQKGVITSITSTGEYLVQLASESTGRVCEPASKNRNEIFEIGEEIIITGYSKNNHMLQFVSVAEI